MFKCYLATWSFQRRLGLRWYRYPVLGLNYVIVHWFFGWTVIDWFIWPNGHQTWREVMRKDLDGA